MLFRSMPLGAGRLAVAAYYAVGPGLAEGLRARPWLRGVVRAMLAPVVSAAHWVMSE